MARYKHQIIFIILTIQFRVIFRRPLLIWSYPSAEDRIVIFEASSTKQLYLS